MAPTAHHETLDDKAARLLTSGCVLVIAAIEDRIVARVRGDSGVYDVEWRHGTWTCTCPFHGDCAHRRAVRQVTTSAALALRAEHDRQEAR